MDHDAQNGVAKDVLTPRRRSLKSRPDSFEQTEVDILDRYIAGISVCDVTDAKQFERYMKSICSFFPLPMSQKALAARLCITPKTLQCWARGEHLPLPLPRTAYTAQILNLLRTRRAELVQNDVAELCDGEAAGGNVCQLRAG